MVTNIRIERDPHVCDFCADPFPVTAYQCENFVWEKDSILPHQSDGAWAACRVCSDLIDGGKWISLHDRAFDKFVKTHGIPFIAQPSIRLTIIELHDLFRAHMRLPA